MDNSKTQPLDLYESLLMEYASGTLDEVLSVFVATHLTLVPKARRKVEQYEVMAGCMMMQSCEPVAMNSSALSNVLARIDDPSDSYKRTSCAPIDDSMPHHDLNIPHDLCDFIVLKKPKPRWRSLMSSDVLFAKITAGYNGAASLRILRMKPESTIPQAASKSDGYFLVLDGQVEVGGNVYGVGEVVVVPSAASYSVQVIGSEECTCAMVSYDLLRFEDSRSRFYNFFLRY